MRTPFYLVALALLAASKAEDNVSPKRLGASAESDPHVVNTIGIETISTNANDDSILEVDLEVEDGYEDPPVETPGLADLEIYQQHSQNQHQRARELNWKDDIVIVPSADFTEGSATVSWPCIDKLWRRNDWICWKYKGNDGSPCKYNEKKMETADLGAPNCSYTITNLQCNESYTLRIKRSSIRFNDGLDFTTGKCACSDSEPCKLWPDYSFFNAANQRCEIVIPRTNLFKTNGKWYFDTISNFAEFDPIINCPIINGQQTTAENDSDCLIYEAPPGRSVAIFDRKFYYSAVFDSQNPTGDLCPGIGVPRNLETDNPLSIFIACYVAEIPSSIGHAFVVGSKMLIKHEHICSSPFLCLTDQGKYVKDGEYDPVEDACFLYDEAKTNSQIVGNLNGGVGDDECICGGQFVYDACVDWDYARRRLANEGDSDADIASTTRALQSSFDPNMQALVDRARLIVERECGAPPVCPAVDPSVGTCTPCSSGGAAQRLADMVYESLSDETKEEIESGELELPPTQGFGSSAGADVGLAASVAAGDFSGAVLPLFFLLSRWYPADGSCKNDGNHLPYMESLGWLAESLIICCNQHFGWEGAFDICMGRGDPPAPTDKSYANYETGTCFQDCAPGPFGCAIAPPPVQLYDTIEDCCAESQPWVDLAYCTSRSVGDLTEGWVVDWTNMKCVKDCDPDEGPPCAESIHADKWATIFETPEECCETTFTWVETNACVADAEGIGSFTDKFYIDTIAGFKCAQDCDIANGLPCMGNPEAYLQRFDTAADCCNGGLGWLDTDKCVADTNDVALVDQGSGEWYVDFGLNEGHGQCVKDCVVGGPSCGGLKEHWSVGYATSAECCAYLSWVEPGDCSL